MMTGRYDTPTAGARGATGPAGATGATGPAWTEFRLSAFSGAGTVTSTAGSLPIGARYYATTEVTIGSLLFRWKRTAASETVRVSIWNAASSRLGFTDVVCASDGVFTATLASPIVIAAYTRFTCSTWDTGATSYCSFTSGSVTGIVVPANLDSCIPCGGNLWLEDSGMYGAAGGDICPTTAWNAGSGIATVSPIVTY